jgi:hypothetical protein
MKVTVVVITFLITLTFVSSPASAQFPDGALYLAQGAQVPEFFMLTISGQTFVATILTFGPSGNNGRWFAAFGSTDGVRGTGQLIIPSSMMFTQPVGTSFQFQLDQSGGATGTFTIIGLESVLSLSSGGWVRVFP